jgi:glutathione S-transferase
VDQRARLLAGNSWLAGDSISIADLFYAPVLFTASLFPEGKQAIAERTKVRQDLDRLIERPTFRRVQPGF